MDAVRTSLMVPHLWQLVDAFDDDEERNLPVDFDDLDIGDDDEYLDYLSTNCQETW